MKPVYARYSRRIVLSVKSGEPVRTTPKRCAVQVRDRERMIVVDVSKKQCQCHLRRGHARGRRRVLVQEKQRTNTQ